MSASAPSKLQEPDTPPLGMNIPTPESNTSTSRPKRKYTRKKPLEASISGIASGEAEQQPTLEDTRRPLTAKEAKIVKNLSAIYAALGFGLTMVKPLAGAVVMQESANRAEEVVRVAAHYPKVMEWLEKIVESNDQVNLAIGHGIMLYAVLIAADRLPLGEKSAAVLAQFGYKTLVQVKLQEAGAYDDSQTAAA